MPPHVFLLAWGVSAHRETQRVPRDKCPRMGDTFSPALCCLNMGGENTRVLGLRSSPTRAGQRS